VLIRVSIQVTKLCGPEPLTKWVVLGVVSLQLTCAYLLRNTPILDWRFLATAYVIGATCNQNLFLAIHEISHNLAFRSPMANRLLAIFANFPIGVPYSAAFRVRSPPRPGTSRLSPKDSKELTQISHSLTI
jgi:sphingolipid delta-4 desaturase